MRDTIDMAREAVNGRIAKTLEETQSLINLEEVKRFEALVRADERERLLPKEPPSGLLMSMAVRYDHGLGMPGYYDHHAFDRFNGDSHAKRLDGTLSIMRQLYEEVSHHGFYSDAREAGWPIEAGNNLPDTGSMNLKVFAELVATEATDETNRRANASWSLMCEKMVAAEREACAKICESLFDMDDDSCSEAEQCAAAIRARGTTK